MKVFLWLLREAGVQDAPSFPSLRKMQADLRAECGIPTHRYESVQGNIYFMNDVQKIIERVCDSADIPAQSDTLSALQDYENPLIRPHLHFYPEIPEEPIAEVWEAEKWRKRVDPQILTPMVAVGPRHFYVFEFARLTTGEYVIPERWVKYKSEMHGEAFRVTFDNNGIASVDDSATVRVKVSNLRDTFLDLSERGMVPKCNSEANYLSPN